MVVEAAGSLEHLELALVVLDQLHAIERGLAANGLERADVVFPVHSHYDHAMDAPEVAKRAPSTEVAERITVGAG